MCHVKVLTAYLGLLFQVMSLQNNRSPNDNSVSYCFMSLHFDWASVRPFNLVVVHKVCQIPWYTDNVMSQLWREAAV